MYHKNNDGAKLVKYILKDRKVANILLLDILPALCCLLELLISSK